MTHPEEPDTGDNVDTRSISGKLERAEQSQASSGSALTGAVPGWTYNPDTGKEEWYPGATKPGATQGTVLLTALLSGLNAPPGGEVPGAATGYTPTGGGPGRFSVAPEDLQGFSSGVGSVHTEYFATGTRAAVIPARDRTDLAGALGRLGDLTPLNQTYLNFREQLLAVLAQLDQLVSELGPQAGQSGSTYQAIEDRIIQSMRRLDGGVTSA